MAPGSGLHRAGRIDRQIDRVHALGECRGPRGDRPLASMTKELPSNTSSSWPPIKLTNTSGIAGLADSRAADLLFTLNLLVHLVGRGVDHQQHLRARRARPAAGCGIPDVLAHQNRRFHAVQFDHRRLRAGSEIALFVENPVIGQRGLAVIGEHRAVANHDGRIEDELALVFRITGDQGDPAHLALQPRDRARDLRAHARMEQQILGRIARHGEFRQHHHIGARSHRAPDSPLDDARGIALDVADDHIELRHDASQTPRAVQPDPLPSSCKFMDFPPVPIRSHRGALF